jgi:DNA primase
MISTTEKDDVRRSAVLSDPQALCTALGLGIDPRDRLRQASGLTVRCPRHGGVSCSVTRAPDGGVRVRCFGCDLTADAFGLIAEVRGMDVRRQFRAVFDEARALAGVAPRVEIERPRTATAPVVSEEGYDRIACAVLEHCSPMRQVSPHVAAYLEARHIFADAEAVDVRGLPRDTRPIARELLSHFERADLESAGILARGSDALDWQNYPLLIPWRDRFGRVTCLQRRRLDSDEPKYRFPSGRPPRAPFGIDLLGPALEGRGADVEVIIVEGALDCLARRHIARHRREQCAVIGVASASTPCAGLPLDMLEGRRVVLGLDDDEAGERACASLAIALGPVVADLTRERPAAAKDWNDCLRGAL